MQYGSGLGFMKHSKRVVGSRAPTILDERRHFVMAADKQQKFSRSLYRRLTGEVLHLCNAEEPNTSRTKSFLSCLKNCCTDKV